MATSLLCVPAARCLDSGTDFDFHSPSPITDAWAHRLCACDCPLSTHLAIGCSPALAHSCTHARMLLLLPQKYLTAEVLRQHRDQLLLALAAILAFIILCYFVSLIARW